MGAMAFLSEPVHVRAPATSANLGPGFDALGLALALHDEVTARVAPAGVVVEVRGEGAAELPTGEDHLVVRAMRAAFAALREQPTGLVLECRNRIPQARGLGSSSAAIVAGLLAARALVDGGPERLPDDEVLAMAAAIEGHPDNVAPCLLGGFTIAWNEGAGARAVRLAAHEGVRPIVFVPAERGYTASARAALPPDVPHRDASFNAGRAALLTHAITGDPALLLPATEDRLHQGYRAESMPGTASLVASLRSVGVAAVVSGAGPTVLALSEVPADFHPGTEWRAQTLGVDVHGALVKGSMVELA